jgi:6,7-dimethyl-8-ribityllumazine synthase
MRFAIVVSRFNAEVTEGLLQGALEYLGEKGATPAPADVFRAPGAFETPLIAQTLARTGRYSGVICLGCVIKGDTAHFEFISLGATVGIMQASLSTETPVSFGILTTYNDEQAEARSTPGAHNKGREAAAACFETAELIRSVKRS